MKDFNEIGIAREGLGQFEKKALDRSRGHRTIHVEPFEDVLNLSYGLDAAGGQPPSAHSE
jgi:hypothetical protein